MVVGPISGGKYTALRVLATAIPIFLAMGITAVVLLAVPAINDALKRAFNEGGIAFKLLVLAPALAMALVTTVLAARILWNASEAQGSSRDDNRNK
ncbi:MAG: hypothetical protein J4G13_00805 [Dehalococcoidia bacterium]|nr:hypothetical protein [Dehalococcoidia bacterium]